MYICLTFDIQDLHRSATIQYTYHLVNIQQTLANHHFHPFSMGKLPIKVAMFPYKKWPVSMAILTPGGGGFEAPEMAPWLGA